MSTETLNAAFSLIKQGVLGVAMDSSHEDVTNDLVESQAARLLKHLKAITNFGTEGITDTTSRVKNNQRIEDAYKKSMPELSTQLFQDSYHRDWHYLIDEGGRPDESDLTKGLMGDKHRSNLVHFLIHQGRVAHSLHDPMELSNGRFPDEFRSLVREMSRNLVDILEQEQAGHPTRTSDRIKEIINHHNQWHSQDKITTDMNGLITYIKSGPLLQ